MLLQDLPSAIARRAFGAMGTKTLEKPTVRKRVAAKSCSTGSHCTNNHGGRLGVLTLTRPCIMDEQMLTPSQLARVVGSNNSVIDPVKFRPDITMHIT